MRFAMHFGFEEIYWMYIFIHMYSYTLNTKNLYKDIRIFVWISLRFHDISVIQILNLMYVYTAP